ncbi:MAG TPA: HAMP domain-containing sensor histidine kinase [Longimicrobiales bacterium]
MATILLIDPARIYFVFLQRFTLAEARHLMLINVLLVLLIVGFSGGIALALVRRSVRERVKAARLAAMGTATARILHQVKNPLQTILLHAEMLQDEALIADAALRREICEAIVGEAMRMTDLLSGLSAYASGVGRRLTLQPMELDRLVREVAELMAREGVHEGVTVRIGALEPAIVAGDAVFLREAIGNVLRNAREALRERTGAGDALLEVELRRRGGEVVVEVRDNGPGIEAERVAQVFEPFVTTKGKGMGLGLPICREIIEGHGGRVELRSKPGVGTTVQLILPLAAAAAPQPA